MSQQYPPQQPYGYGTPPPPPPKKNSTGKIIGIGCGGIVGLIIVISIIGALVSNGDDSKSNTTAPSSAPAAQKSDAAPDKTSEAPDAEEPKEDAPVAITAKNTAFAKSIIADGSNYTSVLVTVTNNSDDPIDVNPLYFTITDANGTKHTAELAADENQISTVTLTPGENVSGTITGKGKFTAKYVTYTDGLIGESMRADVS